MNYIFLYRRITDIDHIVPIIHSLIISGVDTNKIIYTDYFIDKTTINIHQDLRIKYLIKSGVAFKQSVLIKFYNIIDKKYNKKILNKFFFKFIIFVGHKYISSHFFMKLFFLILFSSKKTLFVVDFINIIFIEKLARKLNKKIISVPHGITLHNGMFKNKSKNLRFVLPNLKNYSNYYKLIFYNNISLDLDKFDIPNLKVLGSARYNKQWINFQKNLYPKINNLFDNKNKNILILLEKHFYEKVNNENITIIDNQEITKIINYLVSTNKYNLIIKKHPSSNFNFDYPTNNIFIVDNDKEYKTFQLSEYAHITLGFKSGAISDSIILNKHFLLLEYCQPYELIASKYLNEENIASSFEDFKNKLQKYDCLKNKNDDFTNIYLGAKNKKVLNNYSNFLLSL